MNKALPPIAESAEELKALMRQQSESALRQRLHMLYLLQRGEARTRLKVAQQLGVNRNTIRTWLERYQRGPLACRENAEALDSLHRAKDAMVRRRQRRENQGVYNTYESHKSERSEDALEDFSATGA